jgi:folylpolyglutamate synthase/dihydropteroate synthase
MSLTGKNKLLEAAFKEKEFDPYFCLSLVMTIARNIFLQEVTKAADIYIDTCDNQNSGLVIKRLMKNMKENNQMRKLKITKENKIEKIFKHLHSKNEDADTQISKYKQQYHNKKLSNSV